MNLELVVFPKIVNAIVLRLVQQQQTEMKQKSLLGIMRINLKHSKHQKLLHEKINVKHPWKISITKANDKAFIKLYFTC